LRSLKVSSNFIGKTAIKKFSDKNYNMKGFNRYGNKGQKAVHNRITKKVRIKKVALQY
jgi:hypothetical protein